MGIDRFIEVTDGSFKEVKRILRVGSHLHKEEEAQSPNSTVSHNSLTILSKNTYGKGVAEDIAVNLKKTEQLKVVEAYHLSKLTLLYGDVESITLINNKPYNNWDFQRLIYPVKYAEYDIFQLEYIYTYEQIKNGVADFSLLTDKDEICFYWKGGCFSTFLN